MPETYRIEISPKPGIIDAKGDATARQINDYFGLQPEKVATRLVLTIHANIAPDAAETIAAEFANPVLQTGIVGETKRPEFDWIVVVGFLPGVTDNVGRTAHEAIGDIIGRELRDDEFVFSSTEYLLKGGGLSRSDVEHIAKDLLANELIESITVLGKEDFEKSPLPLNLPMMPESKPGDIKTIDLEVDDEKLMEISSKGILALSIEEMKAIQAYFRSAEGRAAMGLPNAPTDVELEAIAQTWSEHCKHKIFAAKIDYDDGEGASEHIVSLYKSFIQKSTKEIAEKIDWLVSVFHDNAGVVAFNDKYDIAYKVETHNSPSALDPYGGAMTGIVGVNRDPLGTGKGCAPVMNVWGYCLASPFTNPEKVPQGLLHPRRLRDGVHKGVIDGGNQSGIPYGLGWEYFDDRYLGKPLVYCGTVGLLPKKVGGEPGHEKHINPGDLIVMTGGRIGKDGIHGATFSSEELHGESPSQAVQIGDPITQKRMTDFILEARDKNLFNFITDNGAGGLSSSVGEMAEHSGGCKMDLAKAPLKYAGLAPWEILVSEAQERMSFAVPPEKIDEFMELAKRRDVEATVLGEFTDDGKFHILYDGETVAWLDLDFLHDGLPRMKLNAVWSPPNSKPIDTAAVDDAKLAEHMVAMMGRLNICSNEYKARQYDHEVKGLNVVKPFLGVERDIASDGVVATIEPAGKEGFALSAAISPRHAELDTYHMTAWVIDLAIRRIIAVGGGHDRVALLDNFCWPDPVKSPKTPDGEHKLAQLVRANKALYDYTKAFLAPCVSGKDSMKNDSVLGGKKISIPPSLLISAITKVDDVSKAVTLDAKSAGDDIYVIGLTRSELGGSEYLSMIDADGGEVPKIDPDAAKLIHEAVARLVDKRLARSLQAPAHGGLAVSLAKTAMAGRLGLDVDLGSVPTEPDYLSAAEILFSESGARFLLTARAEDSAEIADILSGVPFAKIGSIVKNRDLRVATPDGKQFTLPLDNLLDAYKAPLDGV